jgi:phage tail-like protein
MRPNDIAELLPDVIRRTSQPGTPLDDVLGVMAMMHESIEDLLAHFDRYLDPYRCPERFTPFLAAWVGLDWLAGTASSATPATGDGPLRNLVAEAAQLAKQRGTAMGLQRMLEIGTGLAGFTVEAAPDHPFHVVVSGPPAARAQRDLVVWIIRHEKPAFVTAELALGDEAQRGVGSSTIERGERGDG